MATFNALNTRVKPESYHYHGYARDRMETSHHGHETHDGIDVLKISYENQPTRIMHAATDLFIQSRNESLTVAECQKNDPAFIFYRTLYAGIEHNKEFAHYGDAICVNTFECGAIKQGQQFEMFIGFLDNTINLQRHEKIKLENGCWMDNNKYNSIVVVSKKIGIGNQAETLVLHSRDHPQSYVAYDKHLEKLYLKQCAVPAVAINDPQCMFSMIPADDNKWKPPCDIDTDSVEDEIKVQIKVNEDAVLHSNIIMLRSSNVGQTFLILQHTE